MSKQKINIIRGILIICICLISTYIYFVQDITLVNADEFEVIEKTELTPPNYANVTDWEELGTKIIDWILTATGYVLVLVLLIGGVMYITSAGDEAKADKAKKIIYGAIIGVVAAASTWGIYNFILYYWSS